MKVCACVPNIPLQIRIHSSKSCFAIRPLPNLYLHNQEPRFREIGGKLIGFFYFVTKLLDQPTAHSMSEVISDENSCLVGAVLFLLCYSKQPLATAQSPNAAPVQSSESEEVHRLNQKISAQAEQLAAQQAQINALQSSFAEQKALLLNLLHPNVANAPSAEALSKPAPAPSFAPSSSLPTVAAVASIETISSPALKQEQKEEPICKRAEAMV